MTKILLSCTYYLPNISGVTVYVDILARQFIKKGCGVSVLTSQHRANLKSREKVKGINIYRSRKLISINKGILMPWFWWDAYKQVRQADVIFANLPQVESIWLAVWSKILKKRFVVIHHCEFNFTGSLANKIISVITYPIHLVSYVLADEIISYTQDYAKTSIFLKYFLKKIKYILPPVVVGKENKENQKEIRNKINLKNDKVVGFVGRIAWEKGINYLIEAVSKLDGIKLVLVGPYKDLVGDKSVSGLKKLIYENTDQIVLYGPIEHDRLVDFYKICDCLVLPSTNNLETFGIVQPEAMVCGCPVVASDLPGVRMPVKMTGLGEISKVGDSQDLANKIKKVLSVKYSQTRFDKAKKIFGFSYFIDAYLKLLD